jgi:two-component system OmpR family sensor kinase
MTTDSTPQTTPEPASSEASGVGLILGSRLRQQVVGTTVALTLIAMAALTLLVHEVLASTVEGDVSGLLQDRADAVASTLIVRDGQVLAQETPTETLDRSTWVYDNTGRLVEGAPAEGALRRTVEELSTSQEQSTASVDDEYRLLAVPVQLGAAGVSAVVVVAVNLAPYERTEHYALLVTLALGFVVVLGSAGVAAWSLHRALKPVSMMAARAREWSEEDLDRRFALGESRDEISSLATTFDTLLGRVAEVIRSEQRLSQEMAHELRTPLTTVRAEAEIAVLHPDLPEEPRAALTRIVAACDTMSDAITALMDLARSGGVAGRSTPGDVLAPLLEESQLRPGVPVTVTSVPDGVLIAGPVDLVQRALSPLLDNAVRHAASRVTLRVVARGALVEFHVEDDGPGVEPDDVERLFEPGHRGATSDGAGLGLPLARRVARSLGGDVDAVARTDSQTSAGHFVLTLPRAPARSSGPPESRPV